MHLLPRQVTAPQHTVPATPCPHLQHKHALHDHPPPHPSCLCPASGYLPSFWIKLRLTAVPAVNSAALAGHIPALLGGPTALTVGMVATFIAVSCIIAADTGAYFCGKAFGRTQVRGKAGERAGGAAGRWRCSQPTVCRLLVQGSSVNSLHYLLPCVESTLADAAAPPPPLPAQLTTVSPKKTVEGAIGGLLSSIAVALGLYKVRAVWEHRGIAG